MSAWMFWSIAGLFTLVAAALVAVPLLRARGRSEAAERKGVNIAVYRDQLKEMEADRDNGLLSAEQFETAKVELEARLAEDAVLAEAEPAAQASTGRARWLGLGLGGVLPAAAFAIYFIVGSPAAVEVVGTPEAMAQQGERNVEAMIRAVEAKLKAKPNDGQGWLLLAKTYAALERWPEAKEAYAKAAALLPGEAAAWSGQAEAVAVMQGRNLDGEPLALLEKALKLDANDPKSLELLGIHAFQRQDFARAVELWTRLVTMMPPEMEYTQQLRAGIAEARRQAAAAGKPIAAGPSISGRVELAAALKAKVDPRATVFVFARAVDGPPMPLAAFRATAGDLPVEFSLDDSMSMAGAKLSDHKVVQVVARVSLSGQPMAASGDMEGGVESVKVGSQKVRIVIDKLVP